MSKRATLYLGLLLVALICLSATATWAATYLDEKFEGSFLPTGWTQSYLTGTVPWVQATGDQGGGGGAGGVTTKNALLYVAANGDHKTYLVTPGMNLAGVTSPVLTFYHKQRLWAPDQDTLEVVRGTSPTGPWTTIVSYTSSVLTWTLRTIPLPSVGANYYIGFLGNARWGRGVCVDDVKVTGTLVPVAEAGGPYTALQTSLIGGDVTLHGELSTPVGGLSYAWDLNNNGVYGELNVYKPGQTEPTTATPTVNMPLGVRTVRLRVTDTLSQTAFDTATVTITDNVAPTFGPNFPPTNTTINQKTLAGTPVVYETPVPVEPPTVPPTTKPWFDLSATDNCDAAPTVTAVPPSGHTFPLGPTVVTVTARDASGNSTVRTFTIIVADIVSPELAGVPADITTEQTSGAGAVATWPLPTATDNCDATPTVTCTPPSGSVFPWGDNWVRVQAVDDSANTTTAWFHVIVTDHVVPVIPGPPVNLVQNVGGEQESADGRVVVFTLPTATDVCDAAPLVWTDPPSGSTFPLGPPVWVTVYARDQAGNQTSRSDLIRVSIVDTTAPTVTVPVEQVWQQTSFAGTPVTYDKHPTSPVALWDLCDASPTGNYTVGGVPKPPGSLFPLGSTVVTVTATDASGNTSGAKTFTVRVVDTQAPVITAPNLNVEQTSAAGAVVSYAGVSVVDACDTAPVVTITPPLELPLIKPLGWSSVVTVTARDVSGNVATPVTFTARVVDTTPPTMAQPPDLSGEQAGPAGLVMTYTFTASDICSGTITPVCVPPSGTTFPLGKTTVTVTATDGTGNSTVKTFIVTINDSTAPVITTPIPDFVMGQTELNGTPNWALPNPAVTDACDISPYVSNNAPALLPLGLTVVTWTVIDASGHTATALQNVEVEDETPPTLTCQNLTIEQTGRAGALLATFLPAGPPAPPPAGVLPVPPWLVVTDNCDASPTITTDPLPPCTFPLGTTQVKAQAEDHSGNRCDIVTFTVTVRDTTAPVITAPADRIVGQTQVGGTPSSVLLKPAVTDICDAKPVITNNAPALLPPGPVGGWTMVVWTARDASGNTSTATQRVRVVDVSKPYFVPDPLLGQTLVQTAWNGASRAALVVPVAHDAAGDTGLVVSSNAPLWLPLGDTVVTWRATDASGNWTARQQTVTVKDTGAPWFAPMPPNITVHIPSGSGTMVSYAPTALDVCDTSVDVTCDPVSGSWFPLGTTTVKTVARDDAGNESPVANFTVTVLTP